MDYFKILPLEITLDILTRLPAESVLECKLVSKTWNNLVCNQPSFSKVHSHHLNHPSSAAAADSGKLSYIALTWYGEFYFFEYNDDDNHEPDAPIERIRRINLPPPWDTTTFVGSCNGLICLAGSSTYHPVRTYVCNPVTREYVRLPQIGEDSDIADFYWTSGFGYVSSTNEYKVVALATFEFAEFVEAYIYTLGSNNGWRNLGEFKPQNQSINWEQGVFSNGALYWKDIEVGMIITFDLAEEKFRENLSPPPLPRNSRYFGHKIGVLDGFLYFAACLRVERAYYNDIWLLKKKNDNHDKKEGAEHQSLGWTKEFRVGGEGKLLDVTKSDSVLTYNDNNLNICNTKALTSKRLVDFKGWVCEVLPHKNTFVSLKELGEEDTQIMESIKIEEIESHNQPSIQLQEDETLDTDL